MIKVLTQGGTSSPALFKLYINDLLDQLQTALTSEFIDITDLNQARLVVDELLGLSKDIQSLQLISDTCITWATGNHLRWNLMKSQVLIVRPEVTAGYEPVNLGGVLLKWASKVEYLGLRLNLEVFLGNYSLFILANERSAVYMLSQKPINQCNWNQSI